MKDECALCNPDAGTDCLCPDCLDDAAGYGDLHLRMTLIGQALLLIRQLATPPIRDGDMASIVRVATEHINTTCAKEIAEYDARQAQLREFKRMADLATINQPL